MKTNGRLLIFHLTPTQSISEGLDAMDKVRLRLLDKNDKPIKLGHISDR